MMEYCNTKEGLVVNCELEMRLDKKGEPKVYQIDSYCDLIPKNLQLRYVGLLEGIRNAPQG